MAVSLLASACTGSIGTMGSDPGIPARPAGELPPVEACEDVEPLLELPMRRMDGDEYINVLSALVGEDMSGELVAPRELAPNGGMLRGDTALGMTTGGVDAMINDAYLIADRLLTPEVATRYDDCVLEDETRECAESFLSSLAAVAFRRPVAASEVAQMMGTFDRVEVTEPGEGLVEAVRRVILAPETFYRPELGEDASGEERTLRPSELASRLSFLLHGAPASEELRAAAMAGELDSAEGRLEWTDRLLISADGSPTDAARFHLSKFFEDWLQLGAVFGIDDGDAARAFYDETQAFIDEAIFARGGGTAMLFDAGFSMRNAALSELYGETSGATSEELEAVDMPDRPGLLQQGAFLARTYHDERSAIHRGVYIVRRFLCGTIGDAPPAANEFVSPGTGSERERLDETVDRADCAVCHNHINDLGLAFSGFGEHGERRDWDYYDYPLETAGYVSWFRSEVSDDLDVSRIMASSEDANRCAAEWLHTFAVGRSPQLESEQEACFFRQFSDAPGTLDQLRAFIGSRAFTHNLVILEESR